MYKFFNFNFLMPQFDIFSFFSQLFWVFLGISFLYLLICFYLLPSLAITLKIRKRKLANSTSTNEIVDSNDSNFLGSINNLFSKITTKLTLDDSLAQNTENLSKSLNTHSLSYEAIQSFKQRIIKNVQNITILQN